VEHIGAFYAGKDSRIFLTLRKSSFKKSCRRLFLFGGLVVHLKAKHYFQKWLSDSTWVAFGLHNNVSGYINASLSHS